MEANEWFILVTPQYQLALDSASTRRLLPKLWSLTIIEAVFNSKWLYAIHADYLIVIVIGVHT